MCTRNPSPPPDLSDELQHADTIGDTAYSKRWLFSLLMDLLKLIKSNSDKSEPIEELDADLEERLCCLWDLTVNHDVLPYLEEFNLVSILSEVLNCERFPRLLEICVGILANMAYSTSACQKMSDDETFINRILALFYSRDTPTLTEVCRYVTFLFVDAHSWRSLVQTVLASDEHSVAWLTTIRFQSDFVDNLLFILKNSKNGHLLIAAVRLLDGITRGDDSLAEVWCGSDLLDAILVAQHQMKWLHGNEVEIIHRLLYTFSSNVTGVCALTKRVPLLPMVRNFQLARP
ncbi:hypothetical protein P879_11354 [Paragonimus westermani]|uniref:Protein SAAL1 n=1 Tax=Paragonimus westermani TaxID=34504 RepID=A0A8T0D450_9TREM|nr:hypothetical protein P879_11354 [Paragonimus westermani]